MTVSNSDPSPAENMPHESDQSQNGANGSGLPSVWSSKPKALHRIRTVRREQGMTLRTVARHLGTDVRSARRQEDEHSDLRLSELYRWQAALGVPLVDLLEDPEAPLSRPVMERAHMVRVMKTAMAIGEQAPTPAIQRLAQMLCDQLIELMPELEGVGPWHSVGQRRGLDELGRAVDRCVDDDLLNHPPLDIAD